MPVAHDELRSKFEAVLKAKAELVELVKSAGPEPVEDWALKNPDGSAVMLSELFGAHNDLIVIHNMGAGCRYCSLWADGFRGLWPHIEQRCGFVLCSHDAPEAVGACAAKRGWDYRCVSGQGSGFARAMGYATDDGRPTPGFSAFHKNADGTIVRTGHMPFGPGDDFCAVWPMLELLDGGAEGFEPLA